METAEPTEYKEDLMGGGIEISDNFFEQAGISRDEADSGAVSVHKLGVEAALRSSLLFQHEITADAYNLKDIETGAGRLVAEFDYDEYIWLKMEYPGCMESREFIMDYQRLRGQQFLATPSYTYGNN